MKYRQLFLLLTILLLQCYKGYSQSGGTINFLNPNRQAVFLKYTDKFNDFVSVSIRPGDSVSITGELPMVVYSATQLKANFLVVRGGSVAITIDEKQSYVIKPSGSKDSPVLQFSPKYRGSENDVAYDYKLENRNDNELPEALDGYIRKHIKFEHLVERNQYSHEDTILRLDSHLHCDECLNDDMYRRLASDYTNVLLNKTNALPTLDSISARHTGETKDFLLFMVMKTLGLKAGPAFSNALDKFEKLCRNDAYKEYIKSMHAFNQPGSGGNVIEVNNGHEERFNLTDVLEKSKNKVIFIDFWASWCAPCLEEMKYSSKLKALFPDTDIVFLYVSIDENALAWKHTTKRLGLPPEDSYWVGKEFKDRIKKYYGIRSIPHYVLVEKNGKVFSKNARRPSDPALLREIKYLIGP